MWQVGQGGLSRGAHQSASVSSHNSVQQNAQEKVCLLVYFVKRVIALIFTDTLRYLEKVSSSLFACFLLGISMFCRWVKFEECVEEGGDRWSKPHVATLSLHSLFELRSCILNGVVQLDMVANEICQIAGTFSNSMLYYRGSINEVGFYLFHFTHCIIKVCKAYHP